MFFLGRQFLKEGCVTGAFQNPAPPDIPTHQGDRVGKRQCLLDDACPVDNGAPSFLLWQSPEPQGDQGVETKQTRLGAQDRLCATSTRRFESDVLAGLLEHDFDGPASGVSLDDLSRSQVDVGRKEVFVAMSPRQVFDENPADSNQSLARLVPVRRARHDGHLPTTSAIPQDMQVLPAARPCHHGLGRRLLAALDARSIIRTWLSFRWWIVEVGIAVKLADQRQPWLARSKSCQRVCAITAIPRKDEFSLGRFTTKCCVQPGIDQATISV
jgi:hypothetical protein